jgi:hypothetical protein
MLTCFYSPVIVHKTEGSKSRGRVLGTGSCYGVDNRGVGIRVLEGVRDFFLLHSIYTDSRAHPAFYPVGTGGKAAGA